MQKPTDILSEEHQHILKIIEALNKKCQTLSNSQEIDKAFFTQVIDFIRNYADRFHHAKEEDILFKELCKDSVQMHCDPTQQMLYEHELGRNFVKDLERAVEENNTAKVIENAQAYCQLLKEHIDKEDNILYPMADQALNQQIQESILEKFKQAEEQKFKSGTKEKYLSLAQALNKI